MRKPVVRMAMIAACFAAWFTAAAAQDEDEESPYRSGFIATYSSGADQKAVRIDETVAFDWADAAPDSRLAAGPFSAVWSGRLWTQTPGVHRIAAYVQGRVSVTLAGNRIIEGSADQPQWLVSEPLELEFDRHPLEIAYERKGDGGRLALFWSGPNFVLEPIPERFLMHDRESSPSTDFERGRQLAAALRCIACHRDEAQPDDAMPAPALDRLSGNIEREWLVEWLSSPLSPRGRGARGEGAANEVKVARRMPHFGLSQEEAETVTTWLTRLPVEEGRQIEQKGAKDVRKAGKEKSSKEKKPQPSAEEGERLYLTLGCLACHQHGDLGESGLFGGGDLTNIAAKRPAEFFARWLTDPASLNKHHRMPVFELSADERTSLALWLAKQRAVGNALRGVPPGDVARGEKLIQQFRCAACHTLPGVKDGSRNSFAKQLAAASDWTRSCAGESDAKAQRPGYRLAEDDRSALKTYFSSPAPAAVPGTPQRAFPTARALPPSPQAAGRDLLVQLNCLACHQREGIDRQVNSLPARLQDKLLAVAEAHSELGKLIPAMTPPALNSIGDKLHDAALAAAIRREGPPHRPYLLARMPKFNLSDDQLSALVAYFTTADRVPPIPNELAAAIQNPKSKIQNAEEPRPLVAALQAAGPRLVTTDGFGCTSCHQVGGVLPDKAPLNARGPDISMLEKRIRREWFDRWCFSPARIVPRMEMPSVQVPVRGVLGDNVTDQLAAVWQTLNTPGFEPPEPNPIRVLRLSGVPERKESPIVLHDVVKDGDKTYLFPLVIGLPNRHNILFDLETGRLAAWWLGDTARQRTKGKSWWWELGGKPILSLSNGRFGIWLERRGKEILPSKAGQSAATLLESYSGRVGAASVVGIDFPLEANDSMQRLLIRDAWSVLEQRDATRESGFQRLLMCDAVPPETRLCMRLVDSQTAKKCIWEESHQKLRIPNGLEIRVQPGFQGQEVKWDPDGVIKVREHQKDVSIVLDYVNTLPTIDRYVIEPSPEPIRPVGSVLIAEGILGERLPLPDSLMPTALSWLADGRLVFTTLKGQLVLVEENPSQQLSWRFLDDGLATPYGIQGHRTVVDVLTKTGLYRVLVPLAPGEGKYVRREMLASGWGASEDYHDWAVGLVPKGNDDYFLGFPCQQDQRSDAAARFRGQLLHLKSRGGLPDWPHKPRQFDIEVLSSGHRFPMGLAMNRAGDLFVTDNQGNYNPFNELNHVRPGKHFGFINANEKEAGFKPPPLEEPAINIPHPWTRSVNGICFLDTPVGLGRVGSAHQDSPADAKNGKAGTAHPTIYGPLEGHLIGCEYDTRRLIRMSLQKIGDTYQGAAYPLSIPPDDVEKGLLGPIVCAVKPTTGELYIGEIRDSGWGAGNNVGQIVKIKIEPEKLPCGIAEMKATADGFTLDFFQPVDAKKAADVSNYSLQSYRRESTPAYGGPDLDRRTEKIAAIEVSKDDKRVTLKLPELRERFVYELRLKNLAPKNAMFHPDEAHFTLRQVPK